MATRQLGDAVEAVGELGDAVEQNIESFTPDKEKPELAVADNGYQSPWDRLPSETDYQWDLFTNFRDAGLSRTVMNTVEYGRQSYDWKTSGPDGKISASDITKVTKISAKNSWQERVFKFDAEEERLYQIARSEAIRDMAERHEGIIERAIDGLMTPIAALKEAMEHDPDFVNNLSKKDATKLIDLANRSSRTIPSLMAAERLARGMPTEIVGGVVEHQVVHSVDRNQIGEVLAVLGRAGVLDDAGASDGFGEVVDAEVVEVHSLPAESDDD